MTLFTLSSVLHVRLYILRSVHSFKWCSNPELGTRDNCCDSLALFYKDKHRWARYFKKVAERALNAKKNF